MKRSRLGVMAHRDFRLVAVGNTVSQLGFWAQYVAVGWVATSLTTSKFLIALAFSAQFWPALLLSTPAGLMADRYDRRLLVLYGNVAMAVPPLAIGILIETHHLALWALMVLVFACGSGQAFTQPATVAFIPALVPETSVSSAVATNAGLTNSTRAIGPGFAGLIIAAWGVEWGFYANAISFFAVSAACLAVKVRVKPASRAVTPKMAELRSGFTYSRSKPAVVGVIALLGVVNFFFMQAALLPVIARQVLHGSVSTYGVLSAAPGIGFLIGAFSISIVLRSGRRQRAALVVCSVGLGVSLLLLAASRSVDVSVLALGAFGLAQFTLQTTATTMLITATEDAYRGRVMGVYMTFSLGAIPINSVVAGGLASIIGAAWTVAMCGAAILATIAVFCAARAPAMLRDELDSQPLVVVPA